MLVEVPPRPPPAAPLTPGGTSRRTDVTLRPMGLLLALLVLATAVNAAAAEPPRADLPTYAPGDKGGNQHPVMKGELEGALPLAKVRGR